MVNSLTKEMRIATREIHKISDALVNAKLAFALNNNDVWADGLTVFYEIFKYLEENVSSQILPLEFHRTEQFEKDLAFYKGENWKESYEVRESVQKYLNHLKDINEQNSLLLVAYVYHLYMGLLSGGQILAKKRQFGQKIVGIFKAQEKVDESEIKPGHHLTTFVCGKSIFELKNQMRKVIDDFAEDLDEKTRQGLIDESKKVFEMNNEIILSVQGVNEQFEKRLKHFAASALMVFLGVYVFLKMWRL